MWKPTVIKDYKTILISFAVLVTYVLLLQKGKLENIRSYSNTTQGKVLIMFLILLTLKQSLQIGIMIFLAYMLTLIDYKGGFLAEDFKNYKKSKEDSIGEDLEVLSKEIDRIFGAEKEEPFKGNTDMNQVLSKLKENLDDNHGVVFNDIMEEEQVVQEEESIEPFADLGAYDSGFGSGFAPL
tara:strand:- start:177 stop:722 length:546 start_codon:yes stop_codon:yes gene_type:complete